ncbi:MAG: sugar ABC transporter permease [Acetobacteraceae bacterium]|nr:sugar ABC transporter permease [Acetobacteraceae bacterium]
MSGAEQVLAIGRHRMARWPRWHGRLHGSEFAWAIAFVVPYAAVIIVFGVYPILFGFWMASTPSLYADLFSDPVYVQTLVTTVLFVGIGVNLKMFLALLLSGFFTRPRWWIKAILLIYILPWALSAIPAFTSFHWMMIGPGSFLDSLSLALFGVEGPIWFNDRWLALGCNIVAYVWKWMPFWTLIFLAARMAIPRDIHEAADIDGASGFRRFVHVTFPLLANVYLICTLLSTIWALGDFATVSLVSGGAPKRTTDVLATLTIRYAFDMAKPELGVAAAMSALPVLIPLVIGLMRAVRTREVQL